MTTHLILSVGGRDFTSHPDDLNEDAFFSPALDAYLSQGWRPAGMTETPQMIGQGTDYTFLLVKETA